MAKKRLLCLLMLFVVVITAAYAGTEKNDVTTEKKEFYQDRERGWYFYEKEPKPEEKKKEVKKQPKQYSKPVIDWKAVQTMHPKQFKKLLEDVLDYSIMYPTKENVADYYKLQNVMIKRSESFMNSAMMVVQTNPELSDDSSYPISKVGQDQLYEDRKAKIDNVLRQNSSDYALLYFHSPLCGHCQKQTPILQEFVNETGWTIKPVDITSEETAAVRFNIQSTPSLVMIKRNSNTWILISSGLLSLPELKDRLVRSIEQ